MQQRALFNARILTLDPRRPRADALLITGDRIAAVGSSAEILRQCGGDAQRLDLQDRVLIPGFNDSHVHVVAMGDYLLQPNLRGLDAEQIVGKLREHYRRAPAGQTLYALGWDYPDCPEPHRSILDRAFPDNPVVLVQFSGHGMWLNSRALGRYGIDRQTPDPPGGSILRDSTGEPTGILRDSAAEPVHRSRFATMHFDRARHRELLDRALAELRRAGITSVQDNTWVYTTVARLRRLRRRGELTCRFSCWFYGMIPWMALLMRLQRFDRRYVRRGPWKYLLDGTFSTRTAWLLEPYAGEPENYGHAAEILGGLERILLRMARRRRQGAFHAIGDRTIREFLNVVERLAERNPRLRRLRLRLEHAQLIDPSDFERLRRLGVVVAAQPGAAGTPAKDAALLGRQRAARAYPYRSLLDAGVPLAFGSDFPGEAELAPLLGIHHAVNRPGPEAITALEALTAYTRGSAYAELQEEEKGCIEVGKLADLTVLSEDPLSVPPERIRDIRVEMTYVGGRQVYPETSGKGAVSTSPRSPALP
jgi:predicted amidohydrolase YtcJ